MTPPHGPDDASRRQQDPAETPFGELTPLAPLAPRNARRVARIAGPWHARLWDRAQSALPVVLMGLLAALTWWLVKNTPVPADASDRPPPRHEPDYTMSGFAVQRYSPDGAMLSRVEGDTLRHYPDDGTVEIDGVRLRSIDERGLVVHGQARQALSNADGSQVRLIGGARVVREPAPGHPAGDRLEFRGEFIEVDAHAERIRSHKPVTLLSGRGEVHASTLDYHHLDRIAQLGGRVTGVFLPPGARVAEPAEPAASAP